MTKFIGFLKLLIRLICIVGIVALLVVVAGSASQTVFGLQLPLLLLLVMGGYLLLEFIWLYLDYRHHKKPLLAVDPDVRYSLIHHIKQVTIPTIKYRLQSLLPAKKNPAVQK